MDAIILCLWIAVLGVPFFFPIVLNGLLFFSFKATRVFMKDFVDPGIFLFLIASFSDRYKRKVYHLAKVRASFTSFPAFCLAVIT